jgi:uncharacterized lipoprotein YmbA
MIKATRIAALLLAASLASGCSILRAAPDTSKYFLLSSTDQAAIAHAGMHSEIRFGLGPVKLPGYLDTQQIVRTGAGGGVDYVRGAFWAESLADGFSRSLLYRTGARIGTPNAVAYPWYATAGVQWKVPVDVLRFEATSDGRAVLVARWSVERTSDGRVMAGAQSVLEETAGGDPAVIVDALSRCVDRLADAIAKAVIQAAESSAPQATSRRAR